MKMISKDRFIKQVAKLLELYERAGDAQRTEKMLARLEDSFSLDEFWITEWIFCQYSGEPFVFVEEPSAKYSRICCIENPSELYDFVLRVMAEQKQGIYVHRYCI